MLIWPQDCIWQQRSKNILRTRCEAFRVLFCSEIEDKPWYYDKDFWRGYLDVLAASRFNRFNFTLGLGYDFPRGVTGDYFHFPYPYLVEVPGYDVRVVRLDKRGGRAKPAAIYRGRTGKESADIAFYCRRNQGAGPASFNWGSGPMHTNGPTARMHITVSRG